MPTVPTGEASPLPAAEPSESATATPSTAAGPAGEAQPFELPLAWPWLAGGAAAILFLAALLAMQRRAARRALTDEDAAAWEDDSAPIAEMPAARPADAPPMDGAPLAIRQNEMSGEVPGDQPTENQNPEESLPLPLPPMPAPAFPAIGVLDMALDASRISTTLINATIDYRLLMANTGATRLDTIVIEADMVGAHASLPVEAQLASEGLSLPERHRIDHLAPDQAITLTGSIRLPLADIRAIRQGPAALFVPLVRLRIFARDGDRLLRMARTWVVGEGETADGAGLRPFRLDLGPRVYPVVDQRQL